jgi:hypothetical protein
VTQGTPSDRPPTVRDVQYKGEPLDAARGPGLGCFRFQLIVLAILVFLTPFSVVWGWPDWASATLLIVTLIILLFSGQTIIFLLRLVAADRRAGRRRPLASTTRTVGELEETAGAVAAGDTLATDGPAADAPDGPVDRDGVRE